MSFLKKIVKTAITPAINPLGILGSAGDAARSAYSDWKGGSSSKSSGPSGNVGANSVEATLSSPEYTKYKQDFFNSLSGSSTIADRANQASQAAINARKYGAHGTQQLSAAQESEAKRKGAVDQALALGEQEIARKGSALNALMQEASIRSGANIAQSQIALANQKPQQGILTQFLGGIV